MSANSIMLRKRGDEAGLGSPVRMASRTAIFRQQFACKLNQDVHVQH